MAPASSESQFAFLISCIRYSNNGKVDFTEVAKECGIVSKGAAAKRYERMMKAHGIYQNNQPIRETTIASTPRKRADNSAGSSHKKRKLDQFTESNTDTGDDDEGLQKVKPEAVKAEAIKPESTEATIKEEPLVFDEGTLLDQGYQADNSTFFNDFLEPGAFSQPELEVQSGYGAAYGQDVYGSFDTTPASDVANGQCTSDTILIAD